MDDISFSIEKGDIVGYIGPNGAGKSTTVKMLSGIMRPTSGEILIDGISPQKDRKRVVRNLGGGVWTAQPAELGPAAGRDL